MFPETSSIPVIAVGNCYGEKDWVNKQSDISTASTTTGGVVYSQTPTPPDDILETVNEIYGEFKYDNCERGCRQVQIRMLFMQNAEDLEVCKKIFVDQSQSNLDKKTNHQSICAMWKDAEEPLQGPETEAWVERLRLANNIRQVVNSALN